MKMEFSCKKEINVPSGDAFKLISDISIWTEWSPWSHCEPTAKTEFQGVAHQVGQSLLWEGQVIGSGKMIIDHLAPNEKIGMKLHFLTPFKNSAYALFSIKELSESKCEVEWHLNSEFPIFLFFLKNMMVKFMQNDFDRGLEMLKEILETGKVNSKSTYLGVNECDEFYVIGKRVCCHIDELSHLAKSIFAEIDILAKKGDLKNFDGLVTVSHKHNIPKNSCEFTAGVWFQSESKDQFPEGLEKFKVPSHCGIKCEHLGTYKHLRNGWSMAVSYQRGLKRKLSKTPAYELYLNRPGQIADDQIKTLIVLPIK